MSQHIKQAIKIHKDAMNFPYCADREYHKRWINFYELLMRSDNEQRSVNAYNNSFAREAAASCAGRLAEQDTCLMSGK